MSRNVPRPPALVMVLGHIPDRLFFQATDSFQVLQQPDRPLLDPRVVCYDISLVAVLFRFAGLVVAMTKLQFPLST